jgi:hypothetical protein
MPTWLPALGQDAPEYDVRDDAAAQEERQKHPEHAHTDGAHVVMRSDAGADASKVVVGFDALDARTLEIEGGDEGYDDDYNRVFH